MRTSLFVVALVLAAAPSYAGSKLGKFKKLLVCAVEGEQDIPLGFDKEDGTPAPRVNIAGALDASAKALEDELSAAGIGFIPFSEAEAAGQARQERAMKEGEGKLDAHAATMGQAADTGANAGMAAVMQAAMNNPALTPEQREQMRKALGGSSGQAGAAMTAKAKAGNAATMGEARARAAADAGKGSASTKHVLAYCPRLADEVYDDAGNKDALEFFREVGADGWLSVKAAFGDEEGSGMSGWAPTAAAAGVAKAAAKALWVPRWVYEVRVYDKKGKMAWTNRKPIKGEALQVGKTAASAKKAIAAGAPDGIKALVAEITK